MTKRSIGIRLAALALAAAGVLVAAGGLDPGARLAAQGAPASPDLRRVPQSREQIVHSFAPVVRKVAPAVINVYALRVERSRARSPLFDDPFFRRFFGQEFGLEGPARKRVRTSLGSGVIVDPRGIIVTNVHVIEGADVIRAVLSDRREFEAKVVLTDKRTDLAVLKIDTKGEQLPYLSLRDSDALEVGDLVLAIGNPFGVGQTVTSGIVSALARTTVGVTDFSFFIQTDAAINPGNSGGALVTMDGGLVGINTAIYSKTGGSIGIGFAIPSAMVRAVLAGVSAGRVVRPWLGASSQPVTAGLAKSLSINPPRGVLVNKVSPAGQAAAAGLRVGDVITAVNGRAVNDPKALRFRIATLAVGGTARLDILRAGKQRQISVALSAPPEIPPRETTRISGANPLHGVQVANLSPALADELSMDQDLAGVVILGMAQQSFARRAGIKPKDIIRGVNGRAVENVAALRRIFQRLEGAIRWRLILERKGQTFTLALGG
ncbi:MAG: Do family serine endopeptidase [Alphaproteobacteria bacterium]|nr:Do family serine endopeptidase [Pseudomonadota bacterium]TDI67017.1 MAG: Do family serine endopeptidase [Alphaproteobacteria bacterium]